MWKATYRNSTNASHTKQFIPTIPHRLSISLWPNFNLKQFLTNHGGFRSYLHKMKKTSSPTCNCPERAVQTAKHLMTECSLFAPNRPAVLNNLPPYQILKHHIHTVMSGTSSLTPFTRSKVTRRNQAALQLRYNDLITTDCNI